MSKDLQKENLLVGNEVTFGRYKQSNHPAARMKKIQWIVLARHDEKALLLSKHGLDAKPYHSKYVDITWEDCDLRKWLNTDFLNAAFTPEEQDAILLTKVDNGLEQGFRGYETDGGNNTEDRVLLLSYKEAFEDYFSYAESRTCKPTVYALKCGACTNEAGNCLWWLRSPGRNQGSAACVNSFGSRYYNDIDYDNRCVRPALWINLDSKIFESAT